MLAMMGSVELKSGLRRLDDNGATEQLGLAGEAVVAPGYFMEHSTPARFLAGNLNLLRGVATVRHAPGPLSGIAASADEDDVHLDWPLCADAIHVRSHHRSAKLMHELEGRFVAWDAQLLDHQC